MHKPIIADMKSFFLYFCILGVFLLVIGLILQQGKALETIATSVQVAPAVSDSAAETAIQGILKKTFITDRNALSILVVQLIVILLCVRVFVYLCRKIDQPAVIGEIIAGIFLGPSVLGLFFPEVMNFVFPASSMNNLHLLSQVGLILFMFVLGMELDLKLIKNKIHVAVLVSHISIVFPYLLGVGLSYFIYREYTPDNISFLSFALFMGIAMSITAFPVLSRFVKERGMANTYEGVLALTCAATDDITAWCILAVITGVVKSGTVSQASISIVLTILFITTMIFLVKPFFQKVLVLYKKRAEQAGNALIPWFLIFLFISVYCAEVIGIHALFGAFLAGMVIPESSIRAKLIDKTEYLSTVLLLPLFFAFTGLRTQIGLMAEGQLWLICLVVIVLAVVGKLGGSTVAAGWAGVPWRQSLIIGVLMNTRGLMEVVVLNIGYDLGILTDELFAIMVVMALVTTFMTSPVLKLIQVGMGRESNLVAQ
jgi:Kef-type K+ transport system membrane component KefB